MNFVLDVLIVLISLVFLGIVGTIAGAAIPGLFMAAAAPWLDWIVPWSGPSMICGRSQAGATIAARVSAIYVLVGRARNSTAQPLAICRNGSCDANTILGPIST